MTGESRPRPMSARLLVAALAVLAVAAAAFVAWRAWRRVAPPGAAPAIATAPATGPAGPVRLLPGAVLPEVGARLPEVQGREVQLGQLMGPKGLLVVFTRPSCPQDMAWEDRLVAIGNEAQQAGVGVVAVVPWDATRPVQDQLAELRARREEKGHGFALVVDAGGWTARALGPTRTPEAFVFTSDQRLAYHGAIDDDAQDGTRATAHWLRDAVAALTRDMAPPIAETLPVGCEYPG